MSYTWITPKTDWTSTTPITTTDYNRIRNNLLYINEMLNTRYPTRAETLNLGSEKSLGDRLYPSEINAFEEALVSFERISKSETIGERGYWYDNSPCIGYVDLNRIEMMCLRWYEEPSEDPTILMPYIMGGLGNAVQMSDGVHLLGGYGRDGHRNLYAHVVYHPDTKTFDTLANCPVNVTYKPATAYNGVIYVFYSPTETDETYAYLWTQSNETWTHGSKLSKYNATGSFCLYKRASDHILVNVGTNNKQRYYVNPNQTSWHKGGTCKYGEGDSFNTIAYMKFTDSKKDYYIYTDKNGKVCKQMLANSTTPTTYGKVTEYNIKPPAKQGTWVVGMKNGLEVIVYIGGKGSLKYYQLEMENDVPKRFKELGDLPYEIYDAPAVRTFVDGKWTILVFGGDGEGNDGNRILPIILDT